MNGGERGSGSILAVALVASILSAVVMLVPLTVVLDARQRAAGAADAAALAAADVAIGIHPGSPCATAETLAAANRAAVTECRVDGAVVTVRVSITAVGFDIAATATAGPP